jgi:hypothetical protein
MCSFTSAFESSPEALDCQSGQLLPIIQVYLLLDFGVDLGANQFKLIVHLLLLIAN